MVLVSCMSNIIRVRVSKKKWRDWTRSSISKRDREEKVRESEVGLNKGAGANWSEE